MTKENETIRTKEKSELTCDLPTTIKRMPFDSNQVNCFVRHNFFFCFAVYIIGIIYFNQDKEKAQLPNNIHIYIYIYIYTHTHIYNIIMDGVTKRSGILSFSKIQMGLRTLFKINKSYRERHILHDFTYM